MAVVASAHGRQHAQEVLRYRHTGQASGEKDYVIGCLVFGSLVHGTGCLFKIGSGLVYLILYGFKLEFKNFRGNGSRRGCWLSTFILP